MRTAAAFVAWVLAGYARLVQSFSLASAHDTASAQFWPLGKQAQGCPFVHFVFYRPAWVSTVHVLRWFPRQKCHTVWWFCTLWSSLAPDLHVAACKVLGITSGPR
jgi:hypothetical protein